MLAAFITALAFAVAGDIYDVTLTEKGIKAGVAVEGNTFLVKNNKPTAVALYLRDSLVTGLATAPSIIALAYGNKALFYGFLVGPIVSGVKHVGGGLAWRKLLNGGKLDPNAGQTAWQKFWQW